MLEHLRKDPQLKKVIDTVALPEGNAVDDLYFTILESIVSQQLSVKAADTIFKRFLALFMDNYPDPNTLLQLDAAVLRAVGLSSQKSSYLKNVATFSLERGLTLEHIGMMCDDEVIAYLMQI